MSADDPLYCVPVRDIDSHGRIIHYRQSWRTSAQKLEHLRDLAIGGVARRDAYAAVWIATDLGTVEDCFFFVRDEVRYDNEEIERLETAAYTLHVGEADCDGQAVLLATLVACVGGSCALIAMGGPDASDPSHVATLVRAGGGQIVTLPWQPFDARAPEGWTWAETTIAAELGESPKAAVARVSAPRRADLR
jgi:hypothetical protein